MSTPAEQPSFVLVRRIGDGTVEWIPLDNTPQRVPVASDAAYTLIERADYEAPKMLQAERVGHDLIIQVRGNEALVLEGFFAATGVAFYPTTNIAGGAGAFSGPLLTPSSPTLAGSAGGEQVVWSATPADGEGADAAANPGDGSALAWVGVGAGLLAVGALAGGGGGSGGGGDTGTGSGGPPPPPSDTTPPQITSGPTAPTVVENSGPGKVVYTVVATDAAAVTYGLKAGGDAASFSIDATSGAVTLTGDPDFEAKSSYSFTVIARDVAGNSAEQAVTLNISDVDDTSITITSGPTADPIDENSGANQVVYTVTSNASGAATYSLKPGGDASAFSINASTGAVTLIANPDQEAKSTYAFTVVATSGGVSGERAVSLTINDVDDTAPTITSPASANIDENIGTGQPAYTVTSTDTGDVSSGSTTYSLKQVGDVSAFEINGSTGAVTFKGSPNHETKSSYNFTVVATDAAGNTSERAVALTINDLDESAPTITSPASASVNENIATSQPVYTVTSTDTGDVSSGIVYSLKQVGDAGAFDINGSTGVVTFKVSPNQETKSSYNFTVIATDAAGNTSERAVALTINDVDESAPTITSPGSANVDENIGTGQPVYTVTSTDTGDVGSGNTTYSLKQVGDAGAFDINGSSGAVTFKVSPDHETKSSYNFTVVATDGAGNTSERAVTLTINDLDEVAPNITSGGTAPTLLENTGADQVVYTVASTDTGDISAGTTTYKLGPGGDESFFDIDEVSGAVTLTVNPDFETKSSYNFTVVATDAANNASEQSVSLTIADADDTGPPPDTTAPMLTSISPADEQQDVPVDTNIVLTFSETVLAGSNQLHIQRSGGGDLTIDVDDPTQVTISGNQVTINPTADLDPGTGYEVRIDEGAFTDLAGNPFAGLSGGNAPSFDTVDEADLQGSSVGDVRSFLPDTGLAISVASAAPDQAASSGSETWDGSIDLGSDERILFVSGVDVQDHEAADSGRDAALPNTAMSAQSTAGALFTSSGGQANPMHLEIAAVVVTSQGLA